MKEKPTEAELEAFRERRRQAREELQDLADHGAIAHQDGTITPMGVTGWRCPVCGVGLSPLVPQCACRNAEPEIDLPDPPDVAEAWSKLVEWYKADEGIPITDVEIINLILADLEERDELMVKNIALTNANIQLKSAKKALEKRVEGLNEGAIEHGDFAPLVSKVRALAASLGFESPPGADEMSDVVSQARIQIGMQRDELRAMRKHIKTTELELKTSQSMINMHKDDAQNLRGKLSKLESEVKAKRELIEKLRENVHPAEL